MGLFIVLEGSDGSGKTTQFRLLAARLRAVGYRVETFDFPQYDKPSSHFVRQYLAGRYGPASEISPYTSSLFYAVDRYEAAKDIRKALEQGKIVLANRYTGSNMAHQGAKFGSNAEKRGFFIWAESLEYELLGIPRPTVNFFLNMPAQIAAKLISHRAKAAKAKLDEHESSSSHLNGATETYKLLCELFPKDFVMVNCAKDGKPLDVKFISNMIWEGLKPILPPNPPLKAKEMTISFDAPKPARKAPKKRATKPKKTSAKSKPTNRRKRTKK